MSAPLPKLNAMLVCDQVIADAQTGKKSVIGIFDAINSYAFPCYATLSVYANFTDAQGEYRFDLELLSLSTDDTIGTAEIPSIMVDDKLATSEIGFHLVGLSFDQDGKYEFRLHSNGELFAQKTFSVTRLDKE